MRRRRRRLIQNVATVTAQVTAEILDSAKEVLKAADVPNTFLLGKKGNGKDGRITKNDAKKLVKEWNAQFEAAE